MLRGRLGVLLLGGFEDAGTRREERHGMMGRDRIGIGSQGFTIHKTRYKCFITVGQRKKDYWGFFTK